MRLIDADAYKGKAICNHTYSGVKKLINIDDIPTAYDVDKVVEEIRKAKDKDNMVCYINNKQVIEKMQAIEIVKQGGVADDMCEWQQVTNADKIRNMTDEELFTLIGKIKFCGGLLATEHSSAECRGCKLPFCCGDNADMQWLKREVE